MIQKSELDKIKNMDDEKLKEKIRQIAAASGVNPTMLEGLLSDTDTIRNTVARLSQKDVQKLIENIGEENANKIANIISE